MGRTVLAKDGGGFGGDAGEDVRGPARRLSGKRAVGGHVHLGTGRTPQLS